MDQSILRGIALLIAPMILITGVFAGCADNKEGAPEENAAVTAETPLQVAEQMASRMEKMADIYETITDVESAKQARPSIQALYKQLKELERIGNAIDASHAAKDKELIDKHLVRIQVAAIRMNVAAKRFSQDKAVVEVMMGLMLM